MYLFVLSVHVVLCLILVLVILMQPGKGADVSSAFGGGASSQLFGSAGQGNFLTRGTGGVAAGFFVTSVALTFLSEDAANLGGGASDVVEGVQGDEEGAGFGVAPTDAPTTPPPAPVTPPPADPAGDATSPEGATPADGAAPDGTTPVEGGAPPAPQ